MKCAVVLALAACGRVGFDVTGIESDGQPADSTACTFGAWSAPLPVTELNTNSLEWAPSVSRDGKQMMFSRANAGNGQDLFVVTRADTDAPWSGLQPVTELNSDLGEDDPTLSADGNELIFGDGSIQRSVRVNGTFGTPVVIFEDAQFIVLEGPELSGDGLTLYYNAAVSRSQLFTATRPTPADPFVGFTALSPDPDPTGDAGWPTVSSDDLELIFSSAHGGERDLWTTRRERTSDPFPTATRIDELSVPGDDYDPELSFDGTTIWWASDHGDGTSHDLYTATRSCL